MSRRSTGLLQAGLKTIYYTGGHNMLAPYTQGVGIIFMLHHVRPDPPADFEPNRTLRVTPDFLETAILAVQQAGFDVVSLDQAHWRMVEGDYERSFACFTFDDGYRDNYEHAWPVFRRFDLPFGIYVPSDFADGRGDLWWLALEHIIAEVDELTVRMDGEKRPFTCDTTAAKYATYHEIYWWLRSIDENAARGVVQELARAIGFDPATLCPDLVMDWQQVRAIANDPRVTIGGHTKGHYALSKLTEAEARFQINSNLDRLERELGARPAHFSYPYGCAQSAGEREFAMLRELGVKTAVTTRKGHIHAEHGERLTALPRVSLNGDFQDQRYLDVLLSGLPFVLWNRFRKVAA